MDIELALSQGIESARLKGKEGDCEWEERHPMFRYWWEAKVLKTDLPDWSEMRIRKHIMDKLGVRR